MALTSGSGYSPRCAHRQDSRGPTCFATGKGGKGFGISLWESEQAAQAARDGMAERRREGAQVLGRDTPLDFQIFEVVERA